MMGIELTVDAEAEGTEVAARPWGYFNLPWPQRRDRS
jgi:hypothetical protein